MNNINLNLLQFISLVIFIYAFAYCWMPKHQHTDEYLVLLDKYNRLSDKLKSKIQQSIRVKEQDLGQTTIGKTVSTHSSGIKPIGIYQNDNELVYQMTH